MKKSTIILIAFATFIIISCAKKNETPKLSPVGFWKGQYANEGPGSPPSINYLYLLFRSDGSMRNYYSSTDTTGTDKESGVWTFVNDSTVSWTNNFDESYVGYIRENSTKMVGTLGTSPSNTSYGQFSVIKQ